MRRILVALVGLSTFLACAGLVPAAPAGASGDSARGLVFDGLQRDQGSCRDAFRLVGTPGQTRCSHGPDAAPEGVDVRHRRAPDPWAAPSQRTPVPGLAADAGGVQCYGTGSDGYRVQGIYVHASSVADHFAQYQASFIQWAADADAVFEASAAETGGSRHVRFVTDSSCVPVIDDVTLSSTGDDNIDNTIRELQAKGYTRSDRKYLVWADAHVYCGIAQVYDDDAPGASNESNGNPQISGEFARVDNGCWGLAGQSVEAHELMHTMGGVQTSAPHATRFSHCWDESDRMCYADGSGSKMQQICPSSHENLFDCNHDDYFLAAPAASGTYLASHWNVADSVFLVGTNGSVSPTISATAPAPPRRLSARPSATGGDRLSWRAPPPSAGSSAATGYDVYRRTANGAYALLTSVPASQRTYRDLTTSSGTLYYYEVTAENAAGSSVPSNEASVTTR